MSTQEGALTRHANTAEVRIGGEVIGELTNVSVRESGATDPTHVIGDVKPKEHVHNRYSVQVTASAFVYKKSAANKYGVGGANLLKIEPMNIQATDTIDNKPLFSIIGCTLSDRDMSTAANSRIQRNLTFSGLDVTDGEAAPATTGGMPTTSL